MGKDDDDEAFEAWQHSETVQGPLYRLWEAEKAARTANDPVKREAGRTALGAAAGAFLEGTGVTEQLQQQMLEHVLGELDGGAAYAGKTFEELTRPEMARTKGGLAVLRALAERGVLTLFTLLGAKFSATTVADLRGLKRGHDGIFTFTSKQGVGPGGAPAYDLQEDTITRLGYTVGSRNVLLKKALLERAAAYYNSRARAWGITPVRRTAVRDWTQRAHAKVYRIAVQKGTADREGGKVYNNRGL